MSMPDGFESIDQAMRRLAAGREYDNLAMRAVKSRLTPPAPTDGMDRLRRLAVPIFGEGRPADLHRPGATFVEVLQDIAYEARHGDDAPRYRQLFGGFLGELGLLSGSTRDLDEFAKKSEGTAIATRPAAPARAASPSRPSGAGGTGPGNGPVPASGRAAGGPGNESTSRRIENPGKRDRASHIDSSENVTGCHDRAVSVPEDHRGTAMTGAEKGPLVSDPETVDGPGWGGLEEFEGSVIEHGWEGSRDTPMARIASGELMKLPGILPPPPKTGCGMQYGRWLEGDIWHPLSFNLKIRLGEHDDVDDLFEMLSEFHALPEAACRTYGARKPADPEPGRSGAIHLFCAARDLGRFQHRVDQAAEELAKATLRYFEEFEPRSAEFLTRAGFDVRCDPRLAAVLASALDIESWFIETGPGDAGSGPLPDVRGAISADARLDANHVLDRAVFLHFSSGKSLPEGLVETLTEFRHAQLCRHLGQYVPTSEFDTAFGRDWFLTLDEFRTNLQPAPAPV